MMATPTFNSTSTSTASSNNGYFVSTDDFDWFMWQEYQKVQKTHKQAVNKAYFNSLLFDMSFEYKFSVKEAESKASILFRKQFMQPKCFRNLRF